jgi:phosphonate dehydrogenase
LSGFECRIYYYDPHTSASYSAAQTAFPPPEALPLNELCTRCPLLLVAVPLAPETTHLINRARLNLMSPETLLINIGRGSVVDENAVAEALRQNRLGGYAADVFEFEDLSRPDRPATIPQNLLEQESKTLFTPHLGSMVENIRREIALHAAREILATLPPTVPQ